MRTSSPASQGAGHGAAEVEAVIDADFTGYLTLPSETVSALSLPFLSTTPAANASADGSMVASAVHEARVPWHGNVRPVDVLASNEASRCDRHALRQPPHDGRRSPPVTYGLNTAWCVRVWNNGSETKGGSIR